jgi:RHS repeat-associated protein
MRSHRRRSVRVIEELVARRIRVVTSQQSRAFVTLLLICCLIAGNFVGLDFLSVKAVAHDQFVVFQPGEIASCGNNPPTNPTQSWGSYDYHEGAGVHCTKALTTRQVVSGGALETMAGHIFDQIWVDPSPVAFTDWAPWLRCYRAYVHYVPHISDTFGPPGENDFEAWTVRGQDSVGNPLAGSYNWDMMRPTDRFAQSYWAMYWVQSGTDTVIPDHFVWAMQVDAGGNEYGIVSLAAGFGAHLTSPGHVPPGVNRPDIEIAPVQPDGNSVPGYYTGFGWQSGGCATGAQGNTVGAGNGPLGVATYSVYSADPVNLATGNFVHQATDLTLPGRLLGLSFARFYNSADGTGGPLGVGWTHSFNWKLTDAGATVDVRRGDGGVDRFTRNPDLTYAAPLGVFDTLVKNGDGTFTLTLTNQQAFAFSSAGVLTRISEPAGNHIDLTYTANKLTTITDAVGRAVTLGYDGANRLTQVQDPIGRKVTYGYDASDRLITITDKIGNTAGQTPAEHQWHYAYDGSSTHLATITDPDGRVRVTNSYDALGRVFEQRDGALALTTFDYTTPGQTIETDPRGHATTYTFDSQFRELSESIVVSGTTRTLSYTYDPAGNRDSVTDRNGKRTDFTYDTKGNLLTKTDPQVDISIPRYVTTFHYDSKSNLDQITDARTFVTTHTFDPASNVKLSTSQQITTGPPTYAVTKWEYTDAANPGMPTKVIAPRGNTTGTPNYTYSQTLTYDAVGNLAQRIDADGAKTTFGYDGVGRQTTLIDPDGYTAGGVPAEHTWTTVYDENDQVRQAIDPLTHAALTNYNASGDVTEAIDRNGNVTAYDYDDNARLWHVTQKPEPIAQPLLVYTTTVVRDDNGNATQVTQGNDAATDYGYDELNRLTSTTTHPAPSTSLTTSYVLDGNGNTTTRTTPDTVLTTYGYDALGRLTSISAASLSTITYGYDELSQRTSMIDGTGTSTYQYDGLGRLTQAVQPNGTLSYAYDLDSNRTTLTYPSVGNVTYAFSPGGRLNTVTDWATRLSTYTYTATGRAKTLALPNGMTTVYTYDEAQRLRILTNTTASATISTHTYTLDNEGNRTAIDEIMNGISASAKINTDTGTVVQDHPDIAIGADAASYLIWDDARTGNADIEFSRRDATTGVWSANVKVNTDTGTRIQQNPATALDASNNAYAVWQDERNGAGKADIYFSRRPSATGTWSTPNLKASDDPGASGGAVQRNPRIAGTAAGAETAVWVDLRSSQNNIYASTLSSPWTAWATNKKITDNTAAAKDFPDVAVGSDGTSYAVWQDSRNGNADIFYSTLSSGGATWAANLKISDDPGTTGQTKPRIGIDSGGNLIVAWIDARTSPARVRVARKPAAGAWTASVEVSPSPANVQSLGLAVRSDGFAWVTWGDIRAGASNSDIWGARYDPYLNAWSAPQRLDDATGTTAQLNPTVAFTATEAMLGWRDNRLNANGDTQARRVVFMPGLTDHFTLTYDGLNRLKSITGPVAESFTLDAASNILTRTGPTQTDAYDEANRLTSDGTLSYTWSNADRLSSRGADTFGYDALDRLTSSSVAGTARAYAYNGDGLLQDRTQGTATTFLWDPTSAPSSLLKHGADNIVYGLGPLYVVRGDASTVTFARDGSKNTRVEVSGSGAVTASFRYRAYGEIGQSHGSANPSYLGLASQLRDSSNFYYMRSRWYDSATGRFLSHDSASGDSSEPASLNAYLYAAANPLAFIDPTGREPEQAELDESPCSFVPSFGKCTPIAVVSDDYVRSLVISRLPGTPGSPVGLTVFYAKKQVRAKGDAKVPSPPGASGGRRKLSEADVKSLGLDPHDVKAEALGTKKGLSRFDIFLEEDGRLTVLRKGGRGEPNETYINIRKLGP